MPGIAKIADENFSANTEEHAARKLVLESFPYEVQIGADNRCNLRCGFCLADAYRERGQLHIQDRKLERNPIEIFEAMVPYMRYWKFLSLTGPGESLLNPQLDRILQLIRENSACSIMFTTNGVLINQRLAAIFREFAVDEISISLDSLNKEVFESLRTNAKLEKAIGAIHLLNEEKRKSGKDIPRINLTPTFFKRNIHELPSFVDFAVEHGIHVLQASPGQVYRKTWVNESLLHFPELTRKVAEETEVKATERGLKFVNNLRMVYLNRGSRIRRWLRGKEESDFPTDPSACLKPWSSVFIEPDGEVRPCCYLSPVLGNIYEESFPEIWNGKAARSLRSGMVSGDLPDLCRDCYEFNRHKPEIMISLDEIQPAAGQGSHTEPGRPD